MEISESGHCPRTESAHEPRAAHSAFEARASAWKDYTATPLGRLRRELTMCHLQRHVGSLPRRLRILDAGGGTGSYAVPLAVQGHQVCVLDFSAQMLAIAQERARRRDPALLDRLDFCCASVQDATRLFPSEYFDLILCHTLLEYMERPGETIRTLGSVLRPGGVISLLFVTPYADALRWALAKEDLESALLALSGPVSSADLFGLPRRTFPPEVIREALAQEGMDVLAEYGIRVFADYLPTDKLADPGFFSRLLELELAAGSLYPYSQIGRYMLIVAGRVGAG